MRNVRIAKGGLCRVKAPLGDVVRQAAVFNLRAFGYNSFTNQTACVVSPVQILVKKICGAAGESDDSKVGDSFHGHRYCRAARMTPDAEFYQFSKEVWQTVQDQARSALIRREYCPEDSRVDSIRCVFLDEESEAGYGRQVWFFEASGIDPVGGRHRLYGALDFSVEYGLLEPSRAMLLEDPHHRQRFLESIARPTHSQVWAAPSTRVWVRLTLASVVILSAIWLLSIAAVSQQT